MKQLARTNGGITEKSCRFLRHPCSLLQKSTPLRHSSLLATAESWRTVNTVGQATM